MSTAVWITMIYKWLAEAILNEPNKRSLINWDELQNGTCPD